MKRCFICKHPKVVATFEESGFGGNTTSVVHLCALCDKSMRRVLDGVHMPTLVWAIKRMQSTQAKARRGGFNT